MISFIRSAIDTAWYTILGEPKSCNSRQLSRVFTKYDDIDHWQLTVLHQIIFGFLHLDLKQTLEISSLTIDEPDVYGRTALWWACERADMKSIRTLLEHGANPNIIDREGFSPFLSVLSSECFKVNDRYEMATLMMMQGKVDLNHCTEQGWTPIYLATRWNDIRILELLFSNMPNFDINTREYNGKTALYLAAFDQNVSVVRYLLEKGADISIAEGIGGSNPIHVACTLDDLDALTSLLSFDCSRAIIARTVAGQTPLHLTALYSHPRLAAAILAHDINPDITNGEGQTPLVIAIMHDYIGIAEVLLSYGADIDQITPKGEDLLTTAVDYASVYLVKILLGHGAKPMEQSKTIPSEDDMDIISMSSLHPKTFDHAIIFLSHFPNLPIRNPTDSTVIHIATIRNDPDLLLALETVDLSRFDISAVNKNGMTPADYLEYGSMITERKAAFCRLLHRNHFTSQIICPSCGRRSDLGPVVEVESDEEDDYVDALSEVLVV